MKILLKALKRRFPVDQYFFNRSYSQEGEDMIYRSLFDNRKKYKGFYVDVGALHPYRFSNTMHFYKNGWKGINIEPTPDAKKLFDVFRRRDINLNLGITEHEGSLPFYCFNEPALNSFSKEISDQRAATTKYRITDVIQVPTLPLSAVLDTYLPTVQVIDFMTIDAEGYDLEVLRSNNWDKYQPLMIMVEDHVPIDALSESAVYNFLTAKNYVLIAKTIRTLFFKLVN